MDDNEQVIRDQTLDHWVTKTRREGATGEQSTFEYDCTQFSAPNAPVGLGFTTVATINLEEATVSQTSIVTQTNEVYASAESLYLANHHWWWWYEAGQKDWTYLFKLDIRDASATQFVAAGGVEGHLLNQFSMDEHKGHLRVATTVTFQSEEDDDEIGPTTKNSMIVLDDKLNRVGQTKHVAEGERIYSARFIGDKGFMVTFREVDPLFTVDLKDPKND